MQKDIHSYMTFALAVKAGIEHDRAKRIAWADQFTDDCRDADKYGIATQCGIIDLWCDRTYQ